MACSTSLSVEKSISIMELSSSGFAVHAIGVDRTKGATEGVVDLQLNQVCFFTREISNFVMVNVGVGDRSSEHIQRLQMFLTSHRLQ